MVWVGSKDREIPEWIQMQRSSDFSTFSRHPLDDAFNFDRIVPGCTIDN
jgi:hypothetical protein